MAYTVIDTAFGVRMFNLLQLKYALSLEMKGLKHSQGSVYAHVKRMFGFKGNKSAVYELLCTRIQLMGSTVYGALCLADGSEVSLEGQKLGEVKLSAEIVDYGVREIGEEANIALFCEGKTTVVTGLKAVRELFQKAGCYTS
jgi:hypothetical protein